MTVHLLKEEKLPWCYNGSTTNPYDKYVLTAEDWTTPRCSICTKKYLKYCSELPSDYKVNPNILGLMIERAARRIALSETGMSPQTMVSPGEPQKFSKGFKIPKEEQQVELWKLYQGVATDILLMWFETEQEG